MFSIDSPHAFYVLAAYGLYALFLLGFGLHGLACWRAARAGRAGAKQAAKDGA